MDGLAAVTAAVDFNGLVVRVLAVAGGAALGAFVVGFIVRLAGRFLTSRPVPRPVMMALRLLGAFAFGLAVWLWLFGPGGPGWGGSGGLFGAGGRGNGQAPDSAAEPTDRNQTSRAAVRAATPAETLRVVILPGPVQNERVYRIEGDREPRNLSELKAALEERLRQGTYRALEVVFYDNSNTPANLPLSDLEDWGRRNHLTMKTVSMPGPVP